MSTNCGIRFLSIDSEVLDRLVHELGFDLLLLQECVQGGQRNEPGIHFEEVAQRGPRFGPAEPIGTQRLQSPWQPPVD